MEKQLFLLKQILMEMTPEELNDLFFNKCSELFDNEKDQEEFGKLAKDVIDAAIAESN